jgi:N-acetylglucosaminyl-diphospho-decaprenol L-rhamnosyltransferase
MSGVEIVIITYNSAGHIGACLDSALPAGAPILVVDNASSDETVREVTRRGVRLIANSTNAGFAGAANQGFRATTAPYVLLLNPDTQVVSGIDALRAACDAPNAGAAGGLLLGSGGLPQTGFMVRSLPTAAVLVLEALLLNRLWPSNPVNRHYRCADRSYSCLDRVEQPAGAFLMIRRDVWEKLGGFDDKFYPLWFEDVDFCRRAIDAGYSLYFEPQAVAKHTGGHSIPKISLELRPFYWYRSLLRYTVKHFRPAQVRAVCMAVIAGSFARMLAEVGLRRSFKPVAAYTRVVRLASRCLVSPRGWAE